MGYAGQGCILPGIIVNTRARFLISVIVSLLLVLASPASAADPPRIEWQKVLGGGGNDFLSCINQTSDGGYIMVGSTLSGGSGDVGAGSGDTDIWVVRLHRNGNLQWQKVFGESGKDLGYAIQQTSDGGFIVLGFLGYTSGSRDQGAWIIKLDPAGTIQWQRTLGSSDEGMDIWQTSDGGYVLTGRALYGYTREIAANHGAGDLWVVKLDRGGYPVWQKLYGGSEKDEGRSIRQTSDGGYIVAGSTESGSSGDVGPNHGQSDAWVLKLDSAGNLQWQKVLGGSEPDVGYSIRQTRDGGSILVGSTNSGNSGDVGPNHGSIDIWAVKLDSAGSLQWQRVLGGDRGDQGFTVWQDRDGNYVLAGYASSGNSGDVGTNHGPGGGDFWVVKLDPSGQILWQKMLGGTGNEQAFSIQQTSDNGYVVAGLASSSNTGDVGTNHGYNDFWVVKLAPENLPVPTPTPVTPLVSVGEAATSYQVGFEGLSYNADGRNQLDLDLARARRSMATVSVYTDRVEIYQRAPDGVLVTFRGDNFAVAGDRITGPVKSADFVTEPVTASLSPGIVSGSVRAAFPSLIRAGMLKTTITDRPDPLIVDQFRSVMVQNGLEPGTIAYSYDVRKSNMPPAGNAVVELTLPEQWVVEHGGISAFRIIRVSDTTGAAELVPAVYNGTEKGMVRFRGISANGTSVFGMITLKATGMADANASRSVFPQQQPAIATFVGIFTWLLGLVQQNPGGAVAVMATAGAAYAGRKRGMW